jgi:hypothetical protein
MKNVIVAGVAALALIGCSSKDEVPASPTLQCSEGQELVVEDNGQDRPVETCVDKAVPADQPVEEAPAETGGVPVDAEAAPAEAAK